MPQSGLTGCGLQGVTLPPAAPGTGNITVSLSVGRLAAVTALLKEVTDVYKAVQSDAPPGADAYDTLASHLAQPLLDQYPSTASNASRLLDAAARDGTLARLTQLTGARSSP